MKCKVYVGVVGSFYSHLCAWGVGIASVKLIVLMHLHVESGNHFCFVKQLLYVVSLSCIARQRLFL